MKDHSDFRPSYMSRTRLAHELDISKTTVDEMLRRGVLPRPIRLSQGCVRWRWETVDLALSSLMLQGGGSLAEDPFLAGVMRVASEDRERAAAKVAERAARAEAKAKRAQQDKSSAGSS